MAKLLCLSFFVITLLFFTTAQCRRIDISKTCEDKKLCEVTFSDRGEYLSSIINDKTQKLQFDRLSNSTINVYHFKILETITVQFKTDNIQRCNFITNLTTITMYYGSLTEVCVSTLYLIFSSYLVGTLSSYVTISLDHGSPGREWYPETLTI